MRDLVIVGASGFGREASWLDQSVDSPLVFVPNVDKVMVKQVAKTVNKDKWSKWKWWSVPVTESSWEFSVNDIKIWEKYEWYVKLMYNYWMFITVKWVEWLLHKNWIAPIWDGVEWKKYYNIGDKIEVIAKEFKDIDWERRVVWSQK